MTTQIEEARKEMDSREPNWIRGVVQSRVDINAFVTAYLEDHAMLLPLRRTTQLTIRRAMEPFVGQMQMSEMVHEMENEILVRIMRYGSTHGGVFHVFGLFDNFRRMVIAESRQEMREQRRMMKEEWDSLGKWDSYDSISYQQLCKQIQRSFRSPENYTRCRRILRSLMETGLFPQETEEELFWSILHTITESHNGRVIGYLLLMCSLTGRSPQQMREPYCGIRSRLSTPLRIIRESLGEVVSPC